LRLTSHLRLQHMRYHRAVTSPLAARLTPPPLPSARLCLRATGRDALQYRDAPYAFTNGGGTWRSCGVPYLPRNTCLAPPARTPHLLCLYRLYPSTYTQPTCRTPLPRACARTRAPYRCRGWRVCMDNGTLRQHLRKRTLLPRYRARVGMGDTTSTYALTAAQRTA